MLQGNRKGYIYLTYVIGLPSTNQIGNSFNVGPWPIGKTDGRNCGCETTKSKYCQKSE